jgi:uncharacterized protein
VGRPVAGPARKLVSTMEIFSNGPTAPLRIAIAGGGVAGLSAAWLLRKRHHVTLFEREPRLGGLSHTIQVDAPAGPLAADVGFVVYNEWTYPNLTALFDYLKVPTQATDMSFSVSINGGEMQYSGSGLRGLFAQPSNALRPQFWSMLRDVVRFYRNASRDAGRLGFESLASYLDDEGYGQSFRDYHLYPMTAAIWSTPAARVGTFPAAAFIRFCENHGLLKLKNRPVWRTSPGGSRVYVERLSRDFLAHARLGTTVKSIRRVPGGVILLAHVGANRVYDHVVIAAHADEALAILADASSEEQEILGAFRYIRNMALLHCDPALMPRRRAVLSSWNYLCERRTNEHLSITYWMNKLQGLSDSRPVFVSLNPLHEPARSTIITRIQHEHPFFDAAALKNQARLWSLQGCRNTWFSGSYFGSGFHEDALQAGLAVAEALGGVRRPWRVNNESGRIVVGQSMVRDIIPEFAT